MGIVIVIQTVGQNVVEISALPAAFLIFVAGDNTWRHHRYWCSTFLLALPPEKGEIPDSDHCTCTISLEAKEGADCSLYTQSILFSVNFLPDAETFTTKLHSMKTCNSILKKIRVKHIEME